MKNTYKYHITGKYIIRIFAWKVQAHPGRFVTYLEAPKALWDRAEKYGYTKVTLD